MALYDNTDTDVDSVSWSVKMCTLRTFRQTYSNNVQATNMFFIKLEL